MNNQKRAISSSSAINNLVDAQKPHHLELVKNQKATNCEHQWKFMPSPVEPGWAQKCLHCGEVKLLEGSEQLDELVAWLNERVEAFEQLATSASDENKQAYYQHCASNKQQLSEQVARYLAKAREEENQELLQIEENGNQANPEKPPSLTIKELETLTWTWVESKLIRPQDQIECNDVKFLVSELKLCQFRLSEAKARNDSSAVKKQESRITYLKELQKLAIVIDPQFLTLIPPLSPDEKQQLEANLIEQGCRDALVIWENILLDGHNRFEICQKNNLDFQLHFLELEDRKAAHDWIILNQLGRRNLSADWMSNLRGQIYCSQKSQRGGNYGNQYTNNKIEVKENLAKGQNGTKGNQVELARGQNKTLIEESQNTAEQIGQQFGVAGRTIKRDGKYAHAIDKLCYNFGQEWRPLIIESKLNRTQVIELAKHVEDDNYYENVESILNDAKRGDDFKADYTALMSKVKGTKFNQGQLVQIKFSNTDGLSDEQRLSNGQYAPISELYDHSYQVQLLGQKELLVKAEDIKPVKIASYTVNFEPSEFACLSQQFNSPSELEAALKTRLLE